MSLDYSSLPGEIFGILQLLAPVLLIATAIINWKVIPWYLKTVFHWLKHKTALGVVAVVFTVLGFPLVVAGLFAKALLERQAKRMTGTDTDRPANKTEFLEYEELEEDSLEIPQVLRTRRK